MSFNPHIEARAKNKTVEEIKAEQGQAEEEGEDEPKEVEANDGNPKRPDDRCPTFLELFSNYEGAEPIFYVLEFPIRFCLVLTTPDCRFEKVKD